jgi:hypothetical protein
MPLRIVVMATVLGVLGCGPVEYTSQVTRRATTALEAARTVGAEKLAPYEYTGAVEYLHKAREEGSYAHYQDAINFGHKAEELADKARLLSIERAGRGGSRP